MASNYGHASQAIYDSAQAPYWTNQQYAVATTLTGAAAADISCSQVTVKFSRVVATGVREDIAEFSLAMYVDSGISPPTAIVNAGQAATVEGFLDTWWTTNKVNVTNHWVLSGYSWRNLNMAGPVSPVTGLVMWSPTWRNTTKNVAGTLAGNPLPDQSATSITFETGSRRHWGRAYVPGPGSGNMTVNAKWNSAYVDAIAAATDTLLNSMGTNAAKIVPVVVSLRYRGILSLAAIQVDDVPDVIRRRRAKQKTYAKAYTNTA